MPNSAEDEAIQRRLQIFNNQQGLEQVWWRSAVFRLEGFRQLNTFKAHSDKKAARSAIEPQWLFPLVRMGEAPRSTPSPAHPWAGGGQFCQNGDCEPTRGGHPETCRGFESGVRYIARPTISEVLFSYRRAA
jgi:hypothetical protein